MTLPNMGLSIEGHFHFRIENHETGEVRELDFPNAILDSALDALMNIDGPFSGLSAMLGTSSTAVNPVTQTGLLAPVARSNTASYAIASDTWNNTTPPYWKETTFNCVYTVGAVSGTFYEVGMGYWNGASMRYLCRALIQDSGGTPMGLVVTSAETLTINYRIRVYPASTDVVSTVVISGVTYNYTARVRLLGPGNNDWSPAILLGYGVIGSFQYGQPTVYTGSIGDRNSIPSGTSASISGSTPGAYTNGTFTRNVTFNATINQWNLSGGIKSFRLGNWVDFQVEFSPNIPKTNFDTLSLVVAISIARVA